MQPVILDHATLPEAIIQLTNRWSVENGINASASITGVVYDLRPEIEVTLLRSAQEALANIRKHSRASKVTLTLSYMKCIRILIADDHPVVRAGLQGMLAQLHPDVVLMDLRMAELDGAGATAHIQSQQPGIAVLILTTYDTNSDILRAIEAGEVLSARELEVYLFLSEATVKSHLIHLFGKLGATDRTAAVTVALQHGLLHLETE